MVSRASYRRKNTYEALKSSEKLSRAFFSFCHGSVRLIKPQRSQMVWIFKLNHAVTQSKQLSQVKEGRLGNQQAQGGQPKIEQHN